MAALRSSRAARHISFAASALSAAIARPTIKSGHAERQTKAVSNPAAIIAILANSSLRADRNAARVRLPLWWRRTHSDAGSCRCAIRRKAGFGRWCRNRPVVTRECVVSWPVADVQAVLHECPVSIRVGTAVAKTIGLAPRPETSQGHGEVGTYSGLCFDERQDAQPLPVGVQVETVLHEHLEQ